MPKNPLSVFIEKHNLIFESLIGVFNEKCLFVGSISLNAFDVVHREIKDIDLIVPNALFKAMYPNENRHKRLVLQGVGVCIWGEQPEIFDALEVVLWHEPTVQIWVVHPRYAISAKRAYIEQLQKQLQEKPFLNDSLQQSLDKHLEDVRLFELVMPFEPTCVMENANVAESSLSGRKATLCVINPNSIRN